MSKHNHSLKESKTIQPKIIELSTLNDLDE